MRHEIDSAPRLEAVEWVGSHLESHGQLLVHGLTFSEIVTRALVAIGASTYGAERTHLRLRVHLGWWCTKPCRCRRALASSNHPSWHYFQAVPTDEGAWRGAEVRFFIR